MASSPSFAATVHNEAGLVPGTEDASLTAPTNVTTILTAGASGSRIDEILVQGVGTTIAGIVNIFLYDGATYHLHDQFVITAVTSSTTAAAYRRSRKYDQLILENGWSLRVTNTVAGNVSLLKVHAFGGDF